MDKTTEGKWKESDAHGAHSRIIVIAVRERGVIQAQKYDRAVDQAATDSGHVVQSRARKLYAPAGENEREIVLEFCYDR